MMEQMASQGLTGRAVRVFRFADRATTVLAAMWCGFTRMLGPNYRPEQHYMRGPGPKWRARNSQRFGVINGDQHRRNDSHAADAAR